VAPASDIGRICVAGSRHNVQEASGLAASGDRGSWPCARIPAEGILEIVIGLNGSLVAVLCIADFVLIVCALSLGCAAGDGDRATARSYDELERPYDELERRRRLGSPAAKCLSSELSVAAYARTTMDHDTASREAAQTIGATVLSLQRSQRLGSGEHRAIRCEHRPGTPSRSPTPRRDTDNTHRALRVVSRRG
jgi:hypothetical protein